MSQAIITTADKVDQFWLDKCPQIRKTGFKVFNDGQLSFLASLADESEPSEASQLFRAITGRQGQEGRDSYLSDLSLRFYLAGSSVELRLDINHLNHRSNLKIDDDESIWGNLWSGINNLEIWYQMKEGSAIWNSVLQGMLHTQEDEEGDDFLVPVALEWINQLDSQGKKREFLTKHEEATLFNLNWRQILGLEADAYNLLKYGETGFRLKVMLEAEKGDPDAKIAWEAIKAQESSHIKSEN